MMDFTQEPEDDDESVLGSDSSAETLVSDEGAVAVCEPSSSEESEAEEEEAEVAEQPPAGAEEGLEPAPKRPRREGQKRGVRKLETGKHIRVEPPAAFKLRVVAEWKRIKALPGNIDDKGALKRGTFNQLLDFAKTLERGKFVLHRQNQIDSWDKHKECGKFVRGRKRALGRAGHKSPVAAMELVLIEVIRAKREANHFVSRKEVLVKARELLARPEITALCAMHTITDHWLPKFMSRHSLAFKSVKRMTLHSPEKVAQLAQGFHLYIWRLLGTGKCAWVLNFDEVPMSLSFFFFFLRVRRRQVGWVRPNVESFQK
jgi:hypothetical protein